MFLSSKGTFTTQQAMSRVQETGRLAIDFMAKDIRLAGYSGCISRGEVEVTDGLSSDADGDYKYDFDEALRGYTRDAAATNLSITAKADTDVLVVRSAGSSSLTLTQDSGNSANLRIDGQEVGGCVGDVCEDDVVVISDCVKARRFQITNMQSLGSGDVNVVHAMNGTPGNLSPNSWGQNFGPGAEIIRTSTMVYYIATNDFGQPSLFQQVDDSGPIELLQGVEDMRITYSSNGGSYVASTAVSNWDDVTTVRIELLVRSADDNVIDDPQPYTLAGTTVSDPGDRRMRQVFTTTVALRNRLQ